MIFAGDIGGTSTRLGLFAGDAARPRLVREGKFRSQNYPGLAEIAAEFLGPDAPNIRAACFGVAGPVRHGRVSGTNLAWELHDQSLAQKLNLRSVTLLNDLEANAHGIPTLAAADLVTLQAGEPDASGNRAVISVGTGLGEAGLFWGGQTHHPFSSEGGHADFAPRNPLESELQEFLRVKYGRVSYERVLSGNGQLALYEFLRDTQGRRETPAVAGQMRTENPSAVITRAGLAGACGLCAEALDWYVSFYGAEAGNLALKMMATGGLYIGGGIAPKIIQKLKEPVFLDSFLDKGRLRPLLAAVPVRVILNDQTALLGAARVAHLQATGHF